MASPADAVLQARQFTGVDIQTDPAFLDPSVLQRCDGWVPDLSYLLTKRRGSGLFEAGTGVRTQALLRCYDALGNRYLYAVRDLNDGTSRYFVSTNDAASVQVSTAFAATFARYGMAVLGGNLYIGNGVDQLRKTALGTNTDTAIGPLGVTNVTGATATLLPDTNSTLDTGSYSYAWAIYDAGTKQWVSRAAAQTVLVAATAGSGQDVDFLSPSGALGANQSYHLFVARQADPIERAHDQTPSGLGAAAHWIMRSNPGVTGPFVPLSNVDRRGRYLVAHRGRLWVAGDAANPQNVYATGVIVPGLEQPLFDQGDFFPADAQFEVGKGDGDVVTGLAVGTVTTSSKFATAPMTVFKAGSTWLWQGDIVGDPNADLFQVSGHIGCAAAATIAYTKVGVVFAHDDSVYLLHPDFEEPQEIGQAIAPALKAVPPARRAWMAATYHRDFYKLAITPAGGSGNTQEWWLDLRRGLGSVPSWWGPHTVPPRACYTVGPRDPQEYERGFAGLEGAADTVLHDQATYFDRIPGGGTQLVVSTLKTALLQGDDPFQYKNAERVRAIARASADTTLTIGVVADQGPATIATVPLKGAGGTVWGVGVWGVATWGGSTRTQEAEAIMPALRPNGRGFELEVTHADDEQVDLRDFQLRYLPVARPVQTYRT